MNSRAIAPFVLLFVKMSTVDRRRTIQRMCQSHRLKNATVHALITSRLDSGNALYYGVTDDLMCRLKISVCKCVKLHLRDKSTKKIDEKTETHQALSGHVPSYQHLSKKTALGSLKRFLSVGREQTPVTEPPMQRDLESGTFNCALEILLTICKGHCFDSPITKVNCVA